MSEETEVVDRNYEKEALAEGWAPQEQWKGDPDKWKSAEQFVKDGENISGILKAKVDRLDSRVNELLASNKNLNEMTQRQIKREKEENARLVKELEQVRKQAINDGDGDAFQRAEEQLQSLKEPPQQEQTLDPLAETWLSDNQWYTKNETLGAFADGLADRLRARGYTGQAYYDELTRQVKETFPEEFGNKARKRPNGVETGSEIVIDSKERTFDNLPREAKAAYAQFKRDIPGFTKEQYVSNYEWES